MYIARFSYDVLPVNRERAMEFIRNEVEAARSSGLSARLLVPFTRGRMWYALVRHCRGLLSAEVANLPLQRLTAMLRLDAPPIDIVSALPLPLWLLGLVLLANVPIAGLYLVMR
jgi:hypothetical protein